MEIAKNYIYNMLYQIVTLIIPLITVPYVSRVLGKEGVGTNSYTLSIVQYFVLFGMMGITLYGNRVIATVRENKKKLSEDFFSIYCLQLFMCTLASIGYIVFTIYFVEEDRYIYLIQSLYLIAAAVDISWLFMGLEQFKKTVTRNTIIKIIGLVLVFVFVKKSSDLWIYVLILGSTAILGQAIMWFYLKSTVSLVKINIKMIRSHFIPCLSLFIPQIAIQIYVLLNKTMIGSIATKGDVGIYENSDKIVKMTLAIVTSLGTVMLPRISNTFAKGNLKKVSYYIIQSLNFVSLLSIAIMFGLAGIAKEFVPWFFGKEFLQCTNNIIIISPIVFFIAWSNVLGIQYLVPTGKNKAFTLSVTFGAIVNIILNVFFIRLYKSFGASISTVISEAVVTTVQVIIIRKEVNIFKTLSEIIKYFISGVIMFVAIRIIGNKLGSGMVTTIVQIIAGSFVYITCIISLKSKLISRLFVIIKDKTDVA
ncbi:flippase [Clostridium manihotivorum]|uniref:Flippase n=1 Tax=Clostridium manihotivorum TaxID=2320868 RepID=A0A3R5TJ88_9CLOT|nr:flippase [Clostridium manihotivorum]QAA34762.1 flippase [Clostridium manihotivorum]